MYVIKYGSSVVYESGREELAAFDIKLLEKENTVTEFYFSLPATNPYYAMPKESQKEIVLYKTTNGDCLESEEKFRGKIQLITEDFDRNNVFYCRGPLSYLEGSIQRPSEHHNETPRQFLEYLLENHNNQCSDNEKVYAGAVTVTDPNDSIYRYTNWETTADCISDKLIEDLGGRAHFRRSGGKWYLDYLAGYPNNATQPIIYGTNLTDFTLESDSSDVYTVCIPLGARLDESPIEALDAYLTIESVNDGKDYLENTDAIEIYGRRSCVVEYDDVTTATVLKTKGEAWLEEHSAPSLCVKANAIDLNLTSDDIESIELGDNVNVISVPHSINVWLPVTEKNSYILEPDRNEIVCGHQAQTGLAGQISSATSSTEQRLNRVSSANSILASARANATELINLATNGYVVLSPESCPEEILIMDTPDKSTATKVWRWNQGGLGYSSNGYAGPYTTAITMDGTIVAELIAGTTISGVNVVSQTSNEKFSVKLEYGYCNIYLGETLIGGITLASAESTPTESGTAAFLYGTKNSRGVKMGISDDGIVYNSIYTRYDQTYGIWTDFRGRKSFYDTTVRHDRENFYNSGTTFGGSIYSSDGALCIAGETSGGKVRLGYTDSATSGFGEVFAVDSTAAYCSMLKSRVSTDPMYLCAKSAVYIRNRDNTAYQEIIASTFTSGSKAETKTDIEPLKDGIDIVKSGDIYRYKLKADVEEGKAKEKAGLVIGDGYNCPDFLISQTGEGIDQYSMTAVLWKAVQELTAKVEKLEEEVKTLKGE